MSYITKPPKTHANRKHVFIFQAEDGIRYVAVTGVQTCALPICVTDEELKALEGEASKVIDIAEFVPLESVDPIYFEKTYYLGPDKGGEKAYRLLADAMAKHDRVALAKFVMRGKESLVLIRPAQGGLMLHTMYFADEVRSFGEIDKGESVKIKEGELELALQLIDGLSKDTFSPEKYRDEDPER